MKHLISALLVLALLLAGCQPAPEPGTTAAPGTSAPETLPQGIYIPGSALEQQTSGALRAYELDTESTGMAWVGQTLVVTGNQGTTLNAYTGDDLYPVGKAALEGTLDMGSGLTAVSSQGLGYYLPESRTYVVLDASLRETSRRTLPDDMIGNPVASPSLDVLYYCTAGAIRALDMKTGISRLLRQDASEWVSAVQTCLDGEILACQAAERIVYLETATGALMGEDKCSGSLTSFGDTYFLDRDDGVLRELLFGQETIKAVKPLRSDMIWPLLARNALVTGYADDSGATVLDCYDLTSGLRVACLSLEGTVKCLTAKDNEIWFLLTDAETGIDTLCAWDTAKSAVEDETVYLSQRFTRTAPDAQGLAAAKDRAATLSEAYGVDIRVADDAIAVTGGYIMEDEFHVELIDQGLDELEKLLAAFPEGFLKALGKYSASKTVHISLVRTAAPNKAGIQFWHEGSIYVTVELGSSFEDNFYRTMYHALDTYVFNNSSKLDTWSSLNPKNFSYLETEKYDAAALDAALLEGENRAFVDEKSMTYPREDRAAVFAAAMEAGQEGVFASETMQAKLKSLCQAIRDAFDWKKDSRSFPWEQYLESPLAYTKK